VGRRAKPRKDRPVPRINYRGDDPLAYYVGAFAVSKIYHGEELIFPSGFVMDAETGVFSLFGQDILFQRQYRMLLDVGTFTLSGQSALFQRSAPASVGTYLLTGQDAGFVKSILFPADAGTFTLSGQDVNLTATHNPLVAEVGAFTLAGQDADIFKSIFFTADTGAYLLTGQDVALLQSRFLAAGLGTFVLAGQDANLRRASLLASAAGVFALSGQNATLRRSLRLTASAGSFAVSGQDAQLGNKTIMGIITELGLTSNLKMALDAGDATSLPAASAKWIDLSGNGADFYRGSSAGGDAAEPAINGTAGRMMNTNYLSFDGADYLEYDAANETWMQNIHKDNAIFTALVAFYVNTTVGSQGLISTNRGANSSVGFNIGVSPSGLLNFQVRTGSGAAINTSASGFGVNEPGWNIGLVSVNEGAGTGSFLINGNLVSFTSTYTSPAAGNAAFTMRLGIRGDQDPLESGARMAAVAMWEGVALSDTDLTNIWDRLRRRFAL